MKKKILIIGAGGHAKSCIDVIEKTKKFKIFGIIASKKEIGKSIFGHSVIGSSHSDILKIKKKVSHAFIAIGQIKSSKVRKKYYKILKKFKFKFPAIVSPLSYVSRHAVISEGTIIMHGAKINAETFVGKFSIINTNALIEHDCKIGNFTHISTSAVLNGNCVIGNNTFIGSRSTLTNGANIGENCLIALGSKVTKDVKSNTLFKKK